jgi:1,4-alpha-glucan branching enzyme
MKIKKTRVSQASANPNGARPAPPTRPVVHLEFQHPTAQSVCVAGTFNDWAPGAMRMIPLGHGKWATDVALPAGSYEYCFVVDGDWVCDPAAPERVPNPYGGFNARLRVESAAPL